MSVLTIETLIAMGLVMIGACIQSSFGFGLALMIAPFLFMLNPAYVPAPLCLLVLFISLFNTCQHAQAIDVRAIKMAIMGRIPGSAVGGVILMLCSKPLLELYLGSVVLLALLMSLITRPIKPTPKMLAVAGFFSGVFGTSAAIGGPPMALLLQHEQASSLRANLAGFFILSSILSLIIQGFTGHLTWLHLRLTLPLLPAAWLGYQLAQRLPVLKNLGSLRWPILGLCGLSGIMSIWHGLVWAGM
jgi:uncharacterized protein